MAPESSASDVPISSTGVRRGQVAPESSDSDSQVPVSSTGVKRERPVCLLRCKHLRRQAHMQQVPSGC